MITLIFLIGERQAQSISGGLWELQVSSFFMEEANFFFLCFFLFQDLNLATFCHDT